MRVSISAIITHYSNLCILTLHGKYSSALHSGTTVDSNIDKNAVCRVGRDSSVGIANRYGLNHPGIEFRCGRDFPQPLRPALRPTRPWGPPDPGAHPASYTMGTGPLPGAKRLGRRFNHPLSYSAEVKETAGLYLYSTSGPLLPVTW
jgi:hypothetical protein